MERPGSREPQTAARARGRDLGVTIGRLAPGPLNAITDVAGVCVGHTTLIAGDGPLVVGQGPVRTGVTVVAPRPGNVGLDPLFAGYHTLNGNGEMTGLAWVEESGLLTTAVALTNTHSVGVVRDALIAYDVAHGGLAASAWSLPVVAETWDGYLSDINGMHVRPEHVFAALDTASTGPVAEGCVGGGTGMICHGFKGGIGTASRVVDSGGRWTVGALVQANYGQRAMLRVDGVPVGREIGPEEMFLPGAASRARPASPVAAPGESDSATASMAGTGHTEAGSIIVVIATDAPLLPGGCRRLAQRATIGIARAGGIGANDSGDIFLAFSTANRGLAGTDAPISVRTLPPDALTPLFEAVAEATEEAIVNALCMAVTTTGIEGRTAYALPLDRLREVMRRYQRLDTDV